MSNKITLRAKSDGTEISGELAGEFEDSWDVSLAPHTSYAVFHSCEWDRVYALPTAPGCVFRATVCGVENVRVMATAVGGGIVIYESAVRVAGDWSHNAADIDPATVVIELEGE